MRFRAEPPQNRFPATALTPGTPPMSVGDGAEAGIPGNWAFLPLLSSTKFVFRSPLASRSAHLGLGWLGKRNGKRARGKEGEGQSASCILGSPEVVENGKKSSWCRLHPNLEALRGPR